MPSTMLYNIIQIMNEANSGGLDAFCFLLTPFDAVVLLQYPTHAWNTSINGMENENI